MRSARSERHPGRCPNRAAPPNGPGGAFTKLYTLLDALLGMLCLDLVYARLQDPAGGAPVEVLKIAPSAKWMLPDEIHKKVNQWFGDDPQKWPSRLRASIGDEDISIVSQRCGLYGEIGVIVAGSQRADFPGQPERLVLSVAANQACDRIAGSATLERAEACRKRTKPARVARLGGRQWAAIGGAGAAGRDRRGTAACACWRVWRRAALVRSPGVRLMPAPGARRPRRRGGRPAPRGLTLSPARSQGRRPPRRGRDAGRKRRDGFGLAPAEAPRSNSKTPAPMRAASRSAGPSSARVRTPQQDLSR